MPHTAFALKALGLVIVAAFAMSAVVASTASAATAKVTVALSLSLSGEDGEGISELTGLEVIGRSYGL